VFSAIALLFDKVLKSSSMLAAVEDVFYLPFLLSIDDHRWQVEGALQAYGLVLGLLAW